MLNIFFRFRICSAIIVHACISGATFAASPAASEAPPPKPNCDVREPVTTLTSKSTSFASLPQVILGTDDCSSVRSVLKMLISGDITAGRKLKKQEPLNVPQATVQRKKAFENKDYQAAWREVSSGITDPVTLKVLEAASLRSFEWYEASELSLMEVQALAGSRK